MKFLTKISIFSSAVFVTFLILTSTFQGSAQQITTRDQFLDDVEPLVPFLSSGDCETGSDVVVRGAIELSVLDGKIYADITFESFENDSDRSYGGIRETKLVYSPPAGQYVVRINGLRKWTFGPDERLFKNRPKAVPPSPPSGAPYIYWAMARTTGTDYILCPNNIGLYSYLDLVPANPISIDVRYQ